MRNTTAIITAVALTASTTMANAGGLSPEIMEAPVVIEEVEAPAASSVSPLLIVGGLLAGALVWTLIENNDDDDDDDDDDEAAAGGEELAAAPVPAEES